MQNHTDKNNPAPQEAKAVPSDKERRLAEALRRNLQRRRQAAHGAGDAEQ